MKRFVLYIACAICSCAFSLGQTHMRIHHKGGGHSDMPIEQIDSITFVDSNIVPENLTELTGSWL